MLYNDVTTITKEDTRTIGSKIWREGIQYKTTNIDSIFIASGMWSLISPLACSAAGSYLNTVVSRCQWQIRLG